MESKNETDLLKKAEGLFTAPTNRRSFVKYTGATMAGAGLLLYGCDDDDGNPDPQPPACPTNENNPANPNAVNLGSGNVGILNYAYALEQLEAAFYTQVMAGSYFDGASAEEKQVLGDIQKHEVIHREFFKQAITAAAPSMIIPDLEVDFCKVDFSNRTSVLQTAKTFEDLGVSAYNGAGQFFTSDAAGLTYLGLAGKIVSVEARHAAAIRDVLNPNSTDFAGDDIINSNGLEVTRHFSDVLAMASSYIKTHINASGLPAKGSGFQVTV